MRKTIVYTKRLEKAGLSRKQAEAHLGILEELVEEDMVTKSDFQHGLGQLRSDMNSRFEKMDHKMEKMELRLTLKLGTVTCLAMGVCTGALAAFMKYLL